MSYWKNYFTKGFSTIVILLFTFLVALLLSILPLPYQLKWLMPNWLALVLIYWIIFIPKLVGVFFTFILGIFIDLLLGNLLGTTSLYLIPVAFFADLLCYRFRSFNIWQQFLMITVLIGISQLIRFWIQIYIHHPPNSIMYWISVPISTLTWPLVCAWVHLFHKVIKFC